MAIEAGSLLLLKDGDVATGTLVARCRTNGFTINGETVDVTSKTDNGFRELLGTVGIRSMSVTLEGVFEKGTEQTSLLNNSVDGSLNQYTIIWGVAADSITANFAVTSYENTGIYNDAQTFTATLESSGAIAPVVA